MMAEEQQTQETARMPLIGETAPAFEANTTQGVITFPEDYRDQWVVLFSHPADFTPVCTTEFMNFAKRQTEFEKLNCKLIGLSIDSLYSHIAWVRTIKEKIKYDGMEGVEIKFPVIADLSMEVAKKFGMLQPSASDVQTVRAVFIIDPQAVIRAIVYYPLENGRDMDEILRLVKAVQHTDEHGVATPANWQPGDDVIVPPPGSAGLAQDRVANPNEGCECLDWFLTVKKCPHGE
jgi:peroxiredoxin (alkyl hydroperoxide reductase subunit C)